MDYDMPSFHREGWVYGRKDHACAECLRVIARDEFHNTSTGKWNGDVETFRTCVHCTMLVRWVCRAQPGEGYPIGGLLWEVAEYLQSGYGGLDVARALAAARRLRWRSRRTGALLAVPARLVTPRDPCARPDRLFGLHSRPGDWRFTPAGWASFDGHIKLREDVERARAGAA